MIVHIKFQVHTKCLTYLPWPIYLKNTSRFMGVWGRCTPFFVERRTKSEIKNRKFKLRTVTCGKTFYFFGRFRKKSSDEISETFFISSSCIWQFYITLVMKFDTNMVGLCTFLSYPYQILHIIR